MYRKRLRRFAQVDDTDIELELVGDALVEEVLVDQVLVSELNKVAGALTCMPTGLPVSVRDEALW